MTQVFILWVIVYDSYSLSHTVWVIFSLEYKNREKFENQVRHALTVSLYLPTDLVEVALTCLNLRSSMKNGPWTKID